MFVFRNYTVENLFPGDVTFSGYDDISAIPVDHREWVWFYQVPIMFDFERKVETVNAMASKLRFIIDNLGTGNSLIVCSLMDLFPVEVNDSDFRLREAVEGFNTLARELSRQTPSIRFLDISEFFSRYPSTDWINWRFYFISQMIVAPALATGFKAWFEMRVRQLNGHRRKCLILDLDNTLWGGILGEDGIDGIKIGGDYPGNAFLYFQEALVELSKTGVILAVCSKNNEADVLEAWSKNPFIRLNSNYISSWRINWNNKADNIVEISRELSIGLDSMVFVDDNPTERELVRQRLPMVEVPDFPTKPYDLLKLYNLLVSNYFRAGTLTDEDRHKTQQYRANALRAAESRQFSDLTDFIQSLDLRIDISPADNFNISRIAQMTQKTNQFNLTTRRYTETDLCDFIDRGASIYCISVSDRFGDNGITGAIIVTRDGTHATIDSFLLSCRILGKGIEAVFFKAVMNRLLDEGVVSVTASYIPTLKNQQVADFYDRNGMSLVSSDDNAMNYQMELNAPFEIPQYYTINFTNGPENS